MFSSDVMKPTQSTHGASRETTMVRPNFSHSRRRTRNVHKPRSRTRERLRQRLIQRESECESESESETDIRKNQEWTDPFVVEMALRHRDIPAVVSGRIAGFLHTHAARRRMIVGLLDGTLVPKCTVGVPKSYNRRDYGTHYYDYWNGRFYDIATVRCDTVRCGRYQYFDPRFYQGRASSFQERWRWIVPPGTLALD